MNVTKLTFSVAEAAAALGVGRPGVYQLINDGRLRTLKVGSRTLIPRDALTDFIRTASAGSKQPAPAANDPQAA